MKTKGGENSPSGRIGTPLFEIGLLYCAERVQFARRAQRNFNGLPKKQLAGMPTVTLLMDV